VEIMGIDKTDDSAMAQQYAVVAASQRLGRPFYTPQPQASSIADLRHDDPGERCDLWGLYVGPDMVGTVTLWLPLHDNTDTVWLQLDVHPDHRGRGYGGLAGAAVVDFARDLGRTRVVTTARYPADRPVDHPYRRFAEQHAFRLGSLDVNRRLPLPVPAPVLSGLAERARAAYLPAYRIETFTRVPDALLAPLCACMSRVESDAPSGELEWEEEALTPERLRGFAELDEHVGRLRITSVAREAESGEVVGYTELFIIGGTTKALQSGTFVVSEHRGHRLGLGLKVANLVALQTYRPDAVEIFSINNAENTWMVAVNEELGFEPVELVGQFYRQLP
jgi:GNAT superfamily N-acetyltransferase